MPGQTVLRQWALLRAIPQRRYITANELHDILAEDGYRVGKRTIERDLHELREVFPILLNDKSKPYGWRWDPSCRLFDIPGMDPPTALTFKMVESFLAPLMPQSTLEGMRRHFARAEEVLAGSGSPLSNWLEKVHIIPRGQRLKNPEIDPQVLEVVYRSLLEERRFYATYRTRSGQDKEYVVNPLGLVMRDQVAYLVATVRDYTSVIQLVLHRFKAVQQLSDKVTPPPGFSLKSYIREHRFDYPEGDCLQIDLLFEHDTAIHLYETPLSNGQSWEPQPGGRVRIQARVANTQQLRWWLLGFGSQVEVVAPQSLRREFARIAGELGERYADAMA